MTQFRTHLRPAWALVRLATVIDGAAPPADGGERFRRAPAAQEPAPAP